MSVKHVTPASNAPISSNLTDYWALVPNRSPFHFDDQTNKGHWTLGLLFQKTVTYLTCEEYSRKYTAVIILSEPRKSPIMSSLCSCHNIF